VDAILKGLAKAPRHRPHSAGEFFGPIRRGDATPAWNNVDARTCWANIGRDLRLRRRESRMEETSVSLCCGRWCHLIDARANTEGLSFEMLSVSENCSCGRIRVVRLLEL